MSTISYAQAAKGAAVQSTSQSTPGSPPSTNSQAKDENSTGSASVTAPSVASSEIEGLDVVRNGQSDAEVTLPRQDPEMTEDSAPSITSVADQSTKSSHESDTTVESHHQQDEKAAKPTNRNARSNDGPDARKGRKGKKGRNNDKESQGEQQQQQDEKEKEKEKEKIVLSEAPLPAVNIWKQRQEHRAKQAPAATSTPISGSTNGVESRKSQSAQEEGDAQAANGVTKDKPTKKGSDQSRNTEPGQRRTAPRGARGSEKDDKSSSNLPSVEDTSAWPDPKSAASGDAAGQKSQVKPPMVEREGREESRQSQPRSWQKMEVQHNVIFNTPFSARGGHRPRGGARGGRETGSTREPQATNNTASAQNAASDKTAAVNGTSAPKGNTFHSTRVASQNAASSAPKRASVDGPASKDQRKPSVSTQAESAREPAADNAAPLSKKGVSHRATHGDIRLTNGELGPALPKAISQERPKPSDSGKDGQATSNNQQHGARDGRPERARGGYRNRAGHSGAAGQHVQQSSYAQNGQYTASSFPPRQNPAGPSTPHSGQFAGYGQQPRGRGGQHRWNSTSRNNSNGAGYAARPSAQAGEVPAPQYIHYPYPPPAPYEAMIPLLKAQLEYYFSVDNLCKDMWLRQHMDCQGFVKLDVVASFNRMKKILPSSGERDLLRITCQHSDLIEFVQGDDQIDRLRNREKWREFVLQSADRIEELQHDTPIAFTPYPKVSQIPQTPQFYAYPPPVPQPFPVTSPVDMYSPYPQDPVFQAPYINGAQFEQNGTGPNGYHYHPGTQLSAVVPDFLPAPPHFSLDSLNNISDSVVEQMVVLEKRSSDSSGAGAAGYISNNRHHAEANGTSSQAGPPSSVDASNAVPPSPQTPTWFKGEPSEAPVQRPYVKVKQAALAQRKQANAGETPEEMRNLYEFWSKFLLDKFNAKIYDEFRSLSLEDAGQDNFTGLRHLLDFFKNLFDANVQKPWLQPHNVPEVFQQHYQEAFDLDKKKPAASGETAI